MSTKIFVFGKDPTLIFDIKDRLDEYLIISTNDINEGMTILNANLDIHLAILSIGSTKADGLQLLRYISKKMKHKNIRIIIISNNDVRDDEELCFDLGAHDFFKWPTKTTIFKHRVNNQLKISNQQNLFEQNHKNLEFTYELIFQKAPIGISISHNDEPFGNKHENLVRVNQQFEEICGRTNDQIIKCGWANFTHPDDLDKDLILYKQLQAGEIDSYSMDKRYIKPDQSIVWVSMTVSRLNLLERAVFSHICLIQDITEQKLMLQQLKRDMAVSSAFINSSRDIIFLKDENLRHIFANHVLAEYLDVDIETIIGKTDIELMDADSAEYCRHSDLKVINTNSVVNAIRKVNNQVYEIRKFPVPLGSSKTGVGAYIRDITREYQQRQTINTISETYKIINECMLKPFINIQEQLDYALNAALQLTGSKFGYIYFYREETCEFTLNSWSNDVMESCKVIDKEVKYHLDKTGIWAEVVRQRKPILINDFLSPNNLKKGYPEGHVTIHRFMSIPIFENSKIVAVAGFANSDSDYTNNDIHTMSLLMSSVWIATKKRTQETETRHLLERTQSMFNNHEAVMLLIEPITGQIVEANSAASSFYGYTKEELLKMTIQNINTLSSDELQKLRLKALNKGQKYFTFTHRLKNGQMKTVDVYSSPISYNGSKLLFSIIFDVTEREETRKLNDYLAYHDYLTGLCNRRFFDEEFERRTKNDEFYPNAIVMGDVNGLKAYNDTFGHRSGDAELIDITKRINNFIKAETVFARLGGDEFAIIVSNTSEAKIRSYLTDLERSVNACAGKNSLTLSFGYGIQRKKTDSLDDLLKEAEAFMYNRKYYNNKSTRSNTVNVIMDTLFAKSKREKEHSERVGLISELIAVKMNLNSELIDKIRVAGFLHDIGKIGIDERILNKDGKLDKNEWEIMKLHSAKGAAILLNTFEYREIADFILFHHERYDGSGYPDGLSGDEIPLASRIIAVADSYDAMTNNRSYRNKMNVEDALFELNKYSGILYDSTIIRTFVNEVFFEISV